MARRTLPLAALLLVRCTCGAPTGPRVMVMDAQGLARESSAVTGLAVTGDGRLVVARGELFSTSAWHGVMMLDDSGQLINFAGGPAGYADGTGGAGGTARFNLPVGVAVEPDGSILVADANNARIRRIRTDWTVETVAGTGALAGADGPALSASFNLPWGVTLDGAGSLWIADVGNAAVRRLDATGFVTTVAQIGIVGGADVVLFLSWDALADRIIALQGWSAEVALLSLDHGGNVRVLAGPSGPGCVDGSATAAAFSQPEGVAVDQMGDVLVADTGNHRVRRLGGDGVVRTLVGEGDDLGCASVPAQGPTIRVPYVPALANGHRLYVADRCSALSPCRPAQILVIDY